MKEFETNIQKLEKSENPIDVLLAGALRKERKRWIDPKNSKENWEKRTELIQDLKKVNK